MFTKLLKKTRRPLALVLSMVMAFSVLIGLPAASAEPNWVVLNYSTLLPGVTQDDGWHAWTAFKPSGEYYDDFNFVTNGSSWNSHNANQWISTWADSNNRQYFEFTFTGTVLEVEFGPGNQGASEWELRDSFGNVVDSGGYNGIIGTSTISLYPSAADTYTFRLTALNRADGGTGEHRLTVREIRFVEGDSAPVVDKSALTAKIAEAEALVEADYAPASWAAFSTVLAAAVAVNADDGANQLQVNTAYANLQAAINALIPAGAGEWITLNHANLPGGKGDGGWHGWTDHKPSGGYYEYFAFFGGSWNSFGDSDWIHTWADTDNRQRFEFTFAGSAIEMTVLEDHRGWGYFDWLLRNSAGDTVAEGQSRVGGTNVISNLDLPYDVYTFTLIAMNGGSGEGRICVSEIRFFDGAGAAAVDKSALAAKIAEAGAYDEAGYTAGSWAVFSAALAAAVAVNADDAADQAQVEAALTALTAAIAGLEAAFAGERKNIALNQNVTAFQTNEGNQFQLRRLVDGSLRRTNQNRGYSSGDFQSQTYALIDGVRVPNVDNTFIDGNPDGWVNEDFSWVQVDFGSPQLIDEVVLWPTFDGNVNHVSDGFPRDFTISISEDGIDWTVIYVGEDLPRLSMTTNQYNSQTGFSYPFAAQLAQFVKIDVQRMWRAREYSPGWAGFHLMLAEIEVFGYYVTTTGLSLDQTEATINGFGNLQLNAIKTPADGTDPVVWTSSDPLVARVGPTGIVGAFNFGTTTITARVVSDSGTFTATSVVTVVPVAAQSIRIVPDSVSLAAGQGKMLNFVVTPYDATDKVVLWSSDDTSVATVSSLGYVTAVGPGTTTIRGVTKEGGVEGVSIVTVTPRNPGVQAARLNDFLNSIGTNTRGNASAQTIAEALEYLGIRVVRGTPSIADAILMNSIAGVKFLYGFAEGPDNQAMIDGLEYARQLADLNLLLAIQGPNEPNNWPVKYNGITGLSSGTGASFVPVAQFQRDLYNTVKSDPVLSGYPVFAVAEVGSQPDNVGLQFLTIPDNYVNTASNNPLIMPAGTQFADYGVAHNYLCGGTNSGFINNKAWNAAGPSGNLYDQHGRTWNNQAGFGRSSGYTTNELEFIMPKVSTETGWATNEARHDNINEDQQGKALLALFLSQYARGWSHTFQYKIDDDREGNSLREWGYYTEFFAEQKQSAHYLHNLTRILADDTSDFIPGQLDYTLTAPVNWVHDMLLQRSDGTFMLVVWGEGFTAGTTARDVTIDLGGLYEEVKVYNPIIGKEAVLTLDNVSSLTLSVLDHPFIIEVAGTAMSVDPKEQLAALVAYAGSFDEADYTADSWAAFALALAAAEGVLADDNADAAQIDAAYDALQGAIAGLVPAGYVAGDWVTLNHANLPGGKNDSGGWHGWTQFKPTGGYYDYFTFIGGTWNSFNDTEWIQTWTDNNNPRGFEFTFTGTDIEVFFVEDGRGWGQFDWALKNSSGDTVASGESRTGGAVVVSELGLPLDTYTFIFTGVTGGIGERRVVIREIRFFEAEMPDPVPEFDFTYDTPIEVIPDNGLVFVINNAVVADVETVTLNGIAFTIVGGELFYDGFAGAAGTIADGSVVITLSKAFLEWLGNGQYDIGVSFFGNAAIGTGFTLARALTGPAAAVSVDAESIIDGLAEFTFSLGGLDHVNAVEFVFTLDNLYLTDPLVIETFEGFNLLSILTDDIDGVTHYSAYLVMLGQVYLTTDVMVDIMKISLAGEDYGTATLTLISAEVIGWPGGGFAYSIDPAEVLDGGIAVTEIVDPPVLYSPFDLNKDGSISLIDLAIVALASGTVKYIDGVLNPLWDTPIATDSLGGAITPADCDVVKDDEIDMLDMMEVFLNIVR